MDITLGNIEARFADMLWEREPLTTAEIVRLAAKEFDWKRTTTYTVLKRLSEKGLFKNDNGTVISLISRDEFYAGQSEKFVNETFNGSLQMFLAAFTSRKKLTKEEINEIKKMIEEA